MRAKDIGRLLYKRVLPVFLAASLTAGSVPVSAARFGIAIANKEKTEETPGTATTQDLGGIVLTGKIPEGVKVEAEEAGDRFDTAEMAGNAENQEDKEILENSSMVVAYEVTVTPEEDGKGTEEVPVKVEIAHEEPLKHQKITAWAVDSDGVPERIDDTEVEEGKIGFRSMIAPAFVVTAESLERTIELNGSTYRITATYDKEEANIPDGAELSVTEVTPEDYLPATAEALGWPEDGTVFYAKFLDISIEKDGQEIKPEAPVEVSIQLEDLDGGAESLQVVHFGESGAEEVAAEASADGTICFEAESFSVYGFGGILSTIVSWVSGQVRASVLGLLGSIGVSYTPVETVTGLEEGLELISAYKVTGLLSGLWVKVGLESQMALAPRESVSAYGLKDEQVEDLLADNLENGEQSVPLGDDDGFAVVRDTGYRHLSLDLGNVVLDGMLPVGANAEAEDVREDYMENDFSNKMLAAYDITIHDGEEEYQPDADKPVTVEIANGNIQAGGDYIIWHVLDDGTMEEVHGAEAQDGKIVFTATGFSTYIVARTVLTATITAQDGLTYEINVTYTEDAGIPMDGTKLDVSVIDETADNYGSYVNMGADALGTTARSIALARAFDIKIVSESDPETIYEPGSDVEVSIRLVGEDLSAYKNVGVIHFGDTADPIACTTEGEAVDFVTSGFSVYMVAGYTIEKVIVASDGKVYKVTVTYGENAGIPEGAELSVKEAELSSEEYALYLEEASRAAGKDIHNLAYAKIFDISIVKDNIEYQPTCDVNVTVELLEETAENVEEIQVVHFEDTVDDGHVAAEIQSETEGAKVSFETNGFSLYSFLDFSVIRHVLNAVLGPKEGVLFENDEITLSGKMPAFGIVEAERVTREEEGRNVLVAYDIKIYANQMMKLLGITWQPSSANIQVTIKSDALADETKNLCVYHLADGAEEPEMIGAAKALNSAVSFFAPSFSIYEIIEGEVGGNARLAYRFWYYDSIEERYVNIATEYFRFKDVHQADPMLIYDPGCPAAFTPAEFSTLFEGWYSGVVSSEESASWDPDDDSTKITIDALNNDLAGKAETDFVEGTHVDIIAKLKNVYYVVFVDINPENVLYTAIVPFEDPELDVPTGVRPTRYEERLEAWAEEENLSVRMIPGNTYTINHNMAVVPCIRDGHWMVFNDNDMVDDGNGNMVSGGASYTPSAFYMEEGMEDARVTVAPEDPEWAGYRFCGWYTSPACNPGEEFTFGSYLNRDITLYAKWEPKTTYFRVIVWKQRATDAPNLPDDQKTYDFAMNSDEISAVTGQVIHLSDYMSYTRIYGPNGTSTDADKGYFKYNAAKTQAVNNTMVVKNDGSSVLNVYYDRDVITINFHGSVYYYSQDGSGTPYGDVNGTMTQLTPDGNGGFTQPQTVINYSTYSGTRYLDVTGDNDNAPEKYYIRNGVMTRIYWNNGRWYRTYRNGRYSNAVTPGMVYAITNENTGAQYTDDGVPLMFDDGVWKYEDGTTTVQIPYTGEVQYKVLVPSNSTTATTYTIQGLYGGSIPSGMWPTSCNTTGTSEYWWKYTSNTSGTVTLNAPWNSFTLPPTLQTSQVNARTWDLNQGGSPSTGQTIYYIGENLDGEYNILLAETARASGQTLNLSSEKFFGFSTYYWKYGTNGTRNYLNGGTGTVSTSYYSSSTPLYVYYNRDKFTLTFYTNNVNNDIIPEENVPYQMPLNEYSDHDHGVGPRGCYFVGWYADPSFSEPFDFSQTMPHADVVVYGYWRMERIRVVLVPGSSDVYMGSQSLTFRLDYDESIDGSMIETATRAGYTLDGWYTDSNYTNKWLFSTPVNSSVDGVDMTYQTATKWTSARVNYGDNDEAHANVRGILVLYAKWLEDTTVTGATVLYDPGEGALYDALNNCTTKVPIDAYLHPFGDTVVIGAAPVGYKKLMTFVGWQKVDADGNPVGELVAPGAEVVVTDDTEDAYEIRLDEDDNVIRKVVKYVAVYVPSEDASTRYTTITFDGNTFDYVMYNGGIRSLQGKTRDGADSVSITLDEAINDTIILPGSEDFYLPGFRLVGWSFDMGANQTKAFNESAAVAADNLDDPTNPSNTRENTLYAMWEKKTYTATLKQVINNGVSANTFSYTYGYGEEGDLATGSDSLSGNATRTLSTNLSHYDTDGHVVHIEGPTIPASADYAVQISAYVDKDDGSRESIEPDANGNYPVIGNLTVTYTYSKKIQVTLRKKDSISGASLQGAEFRLTPVKYNVDSHLWDNAGAATTATVNGSLVLQLAAGSYKLEELTPPANHAPMPTPIYMDVAASGISIMLAGRDPVPASTAAVAGTNILDIFNIPLQTVTVTKTVSGLDGQGTYNFTALFISDGARLGGYNTGSGTTNNVGELSFTLANGDGGKAFTVPYGTEITVTENIYVGYEATSTGTSGLEDQDSEAGRVHRATVTSDGTITFTNTRQYTDVTVKKVLENDVTSRDFTFTGALTDNGTNITSTVNGLASFTVNSGNAQGVTFRVPVGARLVIGESVDQAIYSSVTASGTANGIFRNGTYTVPVPANGDVITFTNTRKTVDITVVPELSDPLSATADFTYSASYTLDGVTTVLATNEPVTVGENLLLENIPAGAVLTVTQTSASPDVYTTTSSMGGTTGGTTFISLPLTADGTITFLNTRKEAPVTVRKSVVNGTAVDASQVFNLTASLFKADGTTPLTYGSFTGGTDSNELSFTLTDAGYAVLTVPVGAALTVEEADAGGKYAVSSAVTTGTASITGTPSGFSLTAPDGGADVTVTNTRQYAAVTVTKTLEGAVEPGSFHFTGVLTDGTADITSGVLDVSGTKTFSSFTVDVTNRNGSVQFMLPVGASVAVTEDTYAAYDTTVGGMSTSTASALVTSAGATLAFVNTKRDIQITVSKTVTGGLGNQVMPFVYTLVSVEDELPASTYAYTKTNADGSVTTGTISTGDTFTLMHGEHIAITVPSGKAVTITESNGVYDVSWAQDNGTSVSSNTAAVSSMTNTALMFTNRLEPVAPTDVRADMAPFLALFAAGVVFLAFAFGIRRKRRGA